MNAKKEPMKDYAVQQKKLYEDVTNYCQRNRDAAVQREDLQLREMMAKKLEEQECHDEEEEEEQAEEAVEEKGVVPSAFFLLLFFLNLNSKRSSIQFLSRN